MAKSIVVRDGRYYVAYNGRVPKGAVSYGSRAQAERAVEEAPVAKAKPKPKSRVRKAVDPIPAGEPKTVASKPAKSPKPKQKAKERQKTAAPDLQATEVPQAT